MEAFEFLGGRYNRPEQIMSGPVQAFKAQNAANGKSVFIHRVSTKEAPVEQSALLKLLTTALVRSSDAKRLVLDFGEEQGYWYVVTESEPQCALLREWLQLEIDAVTGNARQGFSTPSAKPAAQPPQQPSGEPGEFTRFLQARPMGSSPSTPRPTTPRSIEPRPPEPASAAPSKPATGEFTSFFSSGMAAETPVAKTPPEPVKTEAGEFTRFFKPGLPPAAAKAAPPLSDFERTQKNRFVQRPDTPMSAGPAVPKTPEAGEFSRLFSQPANAKSPAAPPFTPASEEGDDLFNGKMDLGMPVPSVPAKSEGEFTRVFGDKGAEPPAVQPPAVVATPRLQSLLDERVRLTQPLPSVQEVESKGPSTFTFNVQGGHDLLKGIPTGAQGPSNPAANPVAALPQFAAATGLPAQMSAPRIAEPQLNIPQHVSVAPPGNIEFLTPGKKSGKRTLVIFFVVLVVLALVLVAAMMFLMKNQ